MDVKKQKNVALLLFLSDYKPTNETAVYRFVTGDEYEGKQTNDAPVECLLKMALTNMAGSETPKPGAKFKFGQDEKLYILCITSHKVMTGGEETAWTNFQDTLRKLQEKYIEKDEGCIQEPFELIPIPYDYRGEENNYTKFTEEDEDTNQMAQRIFGEINARLTKNDIRDVYVDYTGGMRDISFLMTTIIRYLEFKGINCQKVVYSQYDKDHPKNNKIRDITYIYEMFQMINGVNEFITTGHATALNEIFKSERNKAGDGEEKEEQKEVKKLLENMVAFSNAMSICDVSNIDENLKNIRDSIITLKPDGEKTDSEDKKNDDNSDLKVAMLKQLLPLMREKMYLEDLDQKDYYVKLIKWCAENNMLQQALTLIEDKMPGVYFDMGLLTYGFKDDAEKAKFKALEFVPKYESRDADRDDNIIFNYITRLHVPRRILNSISTEYTNKKRNSLSQIDNANRDIKQRLTTLSEELKKEEYQEENKFLDSYCEFRRLHDKAEQGASNSNNLSFYPSDFYSILKWCDDTMYSYEYYKNRTLQATVNMFLKMHPGIKRNQEKQTYLEQTFLLHSALKKERNCCNHASARGMRLSADVVKRAIEIYVKRVENVFKFIGA